ncbi:ribonuclease HI family protein [Enterococcus camelliae]|jgi:ribonuclease HI|uniref:Ribonuclease HI family protein n=1 Tax=Enterococcus camelliae TaxID=453959 RepID=A0ABW5TGP8_9ENTE
MLKIHIDASTKGNPGPSGGGFMITGNDTYVQKSFALPQLFTNHQAEFAVLLSLLDYLLENNLNEQFITIYTDSKLVEQTIAKRFTKNPDFLFIVDEIITKLAFFPLLFLKWIPEANNKGADNLARQGLKKALNL